MELERILAGYVPDEKLEDLPKGPVGIAKNVILTIWGTYCGRSSRLWSPSKATFKNSNGLAYRAC